MGFPSGRKLPSSVKNCLILLIGSWLELDETGYPIQRAAKSVQWFEKAGNCAVWKIIRYGRSKLSSNARYSS
jgi:hypothetical protein